MTLMQFFGYMLQDVQEKRKLMEKHDADGGPFYFTQGEALSSHLSEATGGPR